jgi:predicted RNase H-like HicB family nuclease
MNIPNRREMRSPGYIAVTLKFQKEGRRWAAYCEELGTATYGRSIQEALVRIKEAVVLHLDTLEEVGECERFLRDHGIKFYQNKPKQKEIKCSSLDSDSFYTSFIPSVPQEVHA